MPGTMFVATYFFEQAEGLSAGWSESFYMSATSLADALGKVNTTARINRRLNLLSSEYKLTLIRVSDIEVRGDSVVRNFGGTEGLGNLGPQVAAAVDTSEEPWDGLLVRLEAGGLRRRSFILRGLPIGVTTRNYEYNLVDPFQTNFVRWREDLVLAVPFGLRTVAVGVDVLPPPTSVALSATRMGLVLQYPVGAIPGLITNDARIRLSNAPRGLGINGDWRVQFRLETLGQVVLFDKRFVIPCVPTSLVFVKLLGATTIIPITNALARRGASRKTGRPFGSLVGRRRVRRA